MQILVRKNSTQTQYAGERKHGLYFSQTTFSLLPSHVSHGKVETDKNLSKIDIRCEEFYLAMKSFHVINISWGGNNRYYLLDIDLLDRREVCGKQ